jgi:hypothetical protein
MAENRIARELEKRSEVERPKSWQPASSLPEPDKQAGYTYKWIRVSTNGQRDPKNVSAKIKEGWEPVRIEEQPRFKLFIEKNSHFEDGIEIGGLLLCKMPTDFKDQRSAYYAKKNKDQMDSVDNHYLRENDPRMPMFSERKSTTSFGTGR